jgi:acetyl-CoA carboxylase carboxyl transferase subunit beta
MTWLSRVVRPKIQALTSSNRKPELPDNLWHKCANCGEMIFHRDFTANLNVCPGCGHHGRLPVLERLALLFDNGQYTRLELPRVAIDPLKFRDRKRYGERLKEAQAKSGEPDAMIVAHGLLGGQRAVVAAFDFSFMGGSMGTAVGEAIVAAARLAVRERLPLLMIPASGGARMQEGILSLMQMARTTVAVQMLREARLPYIVLLTDPTTGGVTASFAMLGDITLAEPGAVIGFAGARVIEETIREKLPEGFQRAEYLLEHGMVDRIVPRRQLKREIAALIHLLTQPDGGNPRLAAPRAG